MKCPKCGSEQLKISNTRDRGGLVQRQRTCKQCNWIWMTVEVDRDWFRRVKAHEMSMPWLY